MRLLERRESDGRVTEKVATRESGEYRYTTEERLSGFVAQILEKNGVDAEESAIVGQVLTASDLRGIESHGVARLEPYYVNRLRSGVLNARPKARTLAETASSLSIDGENGLGHPVAYRTMQIVIEKALQSGSAFATVRNSNHFGIAGFYAMMALEHDMIGIASTNSVRYGAPTFGRSLMLGTNPLAFAIPSAAEPHFVLDFATTTVPRGKLEVYKRKGQPLRDGWAIDAEGRPTTDPDAALRGALLPLGGFGTEHGGHKGYGLGLLVDLLCGVLSGGVFAGSLPLPSAPLQAGAISHFFGAIRIDGFRDPTEFKRDVESALTQFKKSAKAPGCDRIYVPGEIEYEKMIAHRASGIPVHAKVWSTLEALAREFSVPFSLTPAE
jgi:L-2-hydroxycarboxylate dehydrogenase (NAD+)